MARNCSTLLLALSFLAVTFGCRPTPEEFTFVPPAAAPVAAAPNSSDANDPAERFRAAGLTPLPELSGFVQSLNYTAPAAPSADCRLVVAGKALALNEDYRPLDSTGQGAFDGTVVFAGYGITSKRHDYDDYANIDVSGKVVLAMRYEPMTHGGRSVWARVGEEWSDEAGAENKVKTAAAHGAAALILFTPPGLEPNDPLVPFSPAYKEIAGAIPAFHVRRSVARLILGKNARIDFDDARAPHLLQDKLVAASGAVRIDQPLAHVRNIIGCVPGVGPQANEFVIVGAPDEESGAKAILELAKSAAESAPRRRTVVFCLFTAKEDDSSGATYFVDHPPLDLGNVVAMLVIDWIGPMRNETVYVGGMGTAPDFGAMVELAQPGQPLTARPIPANLDGNSVLGLGLGDQSAFGLKHIPVLFLSGETDADHLRPADASDPINDAGIDEVVKFSDRLIDEMAMMPREPYDSAADIKVVKPPAAPGKDQLPGASLGVIPDYITGTTDIGVLVQGVRPGSAADRAGLQAGDLIVQFGDKPLNSLQNLASCLAIARAGDSVAIKVRRGRQVLILTATLTGRQG